MRTASGDSAALAMNLFLRKPIDQLLAMADEAGLTLKRTLGPFDLVALGIGAIIGAGLFVRTAAADRRPRRARR